MSLVERQCKCGKPALAKRADCRDCRRKRDRRESLAKNYGITPEEYDRLHDAQAGACAICFRTLKKLVVDHCHGSLKVRGLLCGKCNSAIAFLQDNPGIIMNAARYVAKHQET